MRISDWSSDVCSSDLVRIYDEMLEIPIQHVARDGGLAGTGYTRHDHEPPERDAYVFVLHVVEIDAFEPQRIRTGLDGTRSAERRVGKECGRPCRLRCSPYN